MSVLKLKNKYNEWEDVPSIKGEKGDPGDAGQIDDHLSTTSSLPVQNKVIAERLGQVGFDILFVRGRVDELESDMVTVGNTVASHTSKFTEVDADLDGLAEVTEDLLENKAEQTAITLLQEQINTLSERITNIQANRYHVGDIYVCTLPTDPAELFGGTWERLQNAFLFAASDTHPAGETGGEETVTLTGNQSGVPWHYHGMEHTHSHSHKFANNRKVPGLADDASNWSSSKVTSGSTTSKYYINRADGDSIYNVVQTDTDSTAATPSNTSSIYSDAAESHNNMPPYISVYVWKRVA